MTRLAEGEEPVSNILPVAQDPKMGAEPELTRTTPIFGSWRLMASGVNAGSSSISWPDGGWISPRP
jgi:hypothetical protein